MVKTIAFDGDDTLWHNETIFQDTQELLRQLLQPYADDAEVDRKLFDVEMRNLPLFGYGIKGFIISMIETALEISSGQIPSNDVQYIINCGKEMLQAPLELLAEVKPTLEKLTNSYELMLITKGDLMDQRNKLERSGLAEMFSVIEIVHDKNQEIYSKIAHQHGIELESFLMVGNSMRSDILPVLDIGGNAVHVPYHITWKHETTVPARMPSDKFWQLSSIGELPSLLKNMVPPLR